MYSEDSAPIPINVNTAATTSQGPINFAAHQVRSGLAGAREDFEQMIAQLVKATRPTARLIAANPGDWGIDAVVGDLDGGDVEVFQAKYFYPVVEDKHQQQIRDSFRSAHAGATKHGYRLTRWVLCVPASLDLPTAKWWDGWKKRTAHRDRSRGSTRALLWHSALSDPADPSHIR